jgi:hypothetical protein
MYDLDTTIEKQNKIKRRAWSDIQNAIVQTRLGTVMALFNHHEETLYTCCEPHDEEMSRCVEYCIEEGMFVMAMYLLEKQEQLQHHRQQEFNLYPRLFAKAIKSGNVQITRKLFDIACRVYKPLVNPRTIHTNCPVVGTRPTHDLTFTSYMTPLTIAVKTKNISMVECLLEMGADVHTANDEALKSALDDTQMIQYLLQTCVTKHKNCGTNIGCCWAHKPFKLHFLYHVLVKMRSIRGLRQMEEEDFVRTTPSSSLVLLGNETYKTCFEVLHLVLQTNTIDLHFDNDAALRDIFDSINHYSHSYHSHSYLLAYVLLMHGASNKIALHYATFMPHFNRVLKENHRVDEMAAVVACFTNLETLMAITSNDDQPYKTNGTLSQSCTVDLENAFAYIVLRDIVYRNMTLPDHYSF